ncbi:MAG: hypothetical protein GY820_42720 [Gammaproteobacteria bacterium]|nr:hypothetical protein [Gammaproteobacteria bacterium]
MRINSMHHKKAHSILRSIDAFREFCEVAEVVQKSAEVHLREHFNASFWSRNAPQWPEYDERS